MEASLAWINPFLDQGIILFAVLFFLAFANVFLPPVPIETISLGVGYLSANGHGHAVLFWLALAAGMAAGSTVLYYLARSQEHRLLQIPVVAKQVTPARLSKVEAWFGRWGVWIIYAGKLVPGMSFATVLASGLFGAPPRKALSAIYIANLLYFAVTVALGRILGERWYELIGLGKNLWPLVVGALTLLGIIVGAVLFVRNKRQ